ncbi:phosphatidylserine decarboxylase-domain-containing protein [Crucibulum laeve]|uniref:phosphatidylserine decarboxylase n=1 Tax=Crucibulum laeve TaxID=68775 RepID=A0A5C3MFM2_9AGAR|nr:phosphatidylserine decarboxylase-domain-containing protein [Crucibulum laeve]
MASLHPVNINKPIEKIHPDNLPDATHDDLANGLTNIVIQSSEDPDVSTHIHAHMHFLSKVPGIHALVPGIEKLAAEYHVGNFVIVRGSEEPFFESMPLYARIGMHLLFYGREQVKILGTKRIEELLKEQSIKQGQIYDSPQSVQSIPSFVETYSIQTDELLEPDISKYKSFNDFFTRKLKPGARPVEKEDDYLNICSAADCRLTVYPTVDLAKQFWVKGRHFDIPNLLNLSPSSPQAQTYKDASLAIFRLAPADYHRFHSPIDGVIGETETIPGQCYTVNPQAVNEPGFDVFTANGRSILYLKHAPTGLPVAFVAIGALLVGSVIWTGGQKKGESIKRGEELGYFAYGGSTVVVVFPKGVIEFDSDLWTHSQKPIETLVKVGYSIGKTPSA